MVGMVRGAKEIERKLNRLPRNLRRRAINNAARKAADPLVNATKAHIPVDTGVSKKNVRKERWRSRAFAAVYSVGVEHGRLPEDSLFATTDKFGAFRTRSGRLEVRRTTKRERRGEDPFYAKFHELGSPRPHGNGRWPRQRFIENSVQIGNRQAIEIYGNELNRQIDRFL